MSKQQQTIIFFCVDFQSNALDFVFYKQCEMNIYPIYEFSLRNPFKLTSFNLLEGTHC